MISRLDETELLLPLHDGAYEQPQWATFLARLLRRTRADYAALIFRQGDAAMHEATELFAGRDIRAAARALTPGDRYALDPIPYDALRPGRVYSSDELIDRDDPRHDRFRRDHLDPVGLRNARLVRVAEPGGASAWLVVTRETRDFGAGEAALLSALAPHAAIALRSFATLERERLRAAIADDALARSGVGWLALDRSGRLIDGDAAGLRLIAVVAPTPPIAGSRLRLTSPDAERAVAQASAAFAADGDAAPRLIRLSDLPRRDLLAIPARARPLVALAMPALIGFVRDAAIGGTDRGTALATAYALSPGEARLAVALANGASIVEAAATQRLTVETARNYSKRIYAKTGTRGQADLVRLILTGIAALA